MHAGDSDAQEALLSVLYRELHARAQRAMHGQPRDHTLQPTALINEAYMRLVGKRAEAWADRRHFLAVATKAMRQILIDYSRGKQRDKRSAPGERVPIDTISAAYEERAFDLEALDVALRKMVEFDPEMAEAVELRFFGGLSMGEVAELVGMSPRTLDRRWKSARSWLMAEIR